MQGTWSNLFHQKKNQAVKIQAAVYKLQSVAKVNTPKTNSECPGCKQRFSNKSGLARHLQTNPAHDHYTKSYARPQQCDDCKLCFHNIYIYAAVKTVMI